jgi:hypothetical protein
MDLFQIPPSQFWECDNIASPSPEDVLIKIEKQNNKRKKSPTNSNVINLCDERDHLLAQDMIQIEKEAEVGRWYDTTFRNAVALLNACP